MFTPDPNFSAWSFREKFSIRVSMSNFKAENALCRGSPLILVVIARGGGGGA